jgi:hypothetical protein
VKIFGEVKSGDGLITEGELDLGSDTKGFYTIGGVNYGASVAFELDDLVGTGGGEYEVLASVAAVPEPGTILGLLAVGGLGMVSRFKKQK